MYRAERNRTTNITITLTKDQKNTFYSNLGKCGFISPKGDGVMYTKLDHEHFLNKLLFSVKENVDEECRPTNVKVYLIAFAGFIYLEFDSALNGHDRFFTYAEYLRFVPTLIEKLGVKWYPINDMSMIHRLAETDS